ncbi:hypothetical protein OKW98_12595 [Pseudomonas sp. KU26590]|uniref:hypothetical protein n=1 Tax=Pseudomonas sp. KU26590 TaxID=2991051 RepID=UPI00223D3A91|nr:hypothetical protein [Pseudomonas sp. KU26590]UZJ62496.1 hypothetical protein OKW98_12595 [Pseudomonas sp. KU26590]
MLIGNSAIQQFVSKAVSHTHYATADTDAYTSAMAGAATPVAAIASNGEGATQSSNDGKQGYDESFAKMMVNLKAAAANTASSVTDDDKAAAAAAFVSSADKQVAASDSVSKTVSDDLAASDGAAGSDGVGSVKDQFLSYMNQTDAEKVRQRLTGVSKAEYDAMSPDEQAAVNKQVTELQKQKTDQQVAEQEVKTRIAMAKAEMA